MQTQQDQQLEERAAVLSNLRLEDDQPYVEGGPNATVLVDTTLNVNFQDRNAYETHWIEETIAMEKLEDILKTGEKFINDVYTFRGCSKALPQVKTAEQANKQEIYEKSFEVLEPEVKRLRELMYFQRDATRVFCEGVRRIASTLKEKKKSEDYFVSESMIGHFIRMLDLFAILDAIKNIKASLNNDFSFYRRALSIVRKAADETQENNHVYIFLANQNSITTSLKSEIQGIDGFDEVLTMVVDQCADYLEAGRYLLPAEKHSLLRVMPYALFLMDGDKNNIFRKKDFNLSKYSRIFKRTPVVPLFGDMQMTLEVQIRRAPHFDEKVWGAGTDDVKLNQEYELLHLLPSTRSANNDYTAKFSNMINDIKISQRVNPNYVPSPPECRDIVTTVLQGLQLLGDWTAKVLEQSAWKYSRPVNDPNITTEYERVVRFNYTAEEKVALVEFIAMIKGLASLILRYEPILTPLIKRAIHDELQEFIQVIMREMIRSVSKNAKKKVNIRTELLNLRTLAADWQNGTEPVADPALYGKKSGKDDDKIQLPIRNVGPSPTQLALVRAIVYGLICRKKEFSSSQAKELEEFYERSFFYRYVLNISSTLLSVTDLADLWYREFYLELSKRLQFPIEMSLPWILTDHILEKKDAGLMESVLYPLDIYNDAGQRALSKLGTRFLYDEIEAEVNLCFDQLVFKLSDQIFTWFKIQASSILLDKPYKTQLEIALAPNSRYNIPKSRYEVIMRQRHFQLLGRSLDLNSLIAESLNSYQRQNLEYAISRFEASSLTSVIELEHQLVNIRLVHRLLSQYFQLDPWDEILNEINESTSLVSFHGRIVLHIIFELVNDFLPNYNYNQITQRFVRTPFAFQPDATRDAMPKTNFTFMQGHRHLSTAVTNSEELAKSFFGQAHFRALLRLVGSAGLSLTVGEILRNMELKLLNFLAPYVSELQKGMPQSSKLPMHDYGTEGAYGYFQFKLKDMFTYPDLRQEVLHNFRIFGNSIVFMSLLDLYLTESQSLNFLHVAPFLGYAPNDMSPDDTQSPLYTSIQRVAQVLLEQKSQLVKCPEAIQDIVMNAWRADRFYRPPNQASNENYSLFKSVLLRIYSMLAPVRPEWSETIAENGVINIDYTTEFYRLWSALQFVVCFHTTSENDATCHELFGDGLMWAGATIIHFLGQHERFEVFDFSYHILRVEEAAPVACQKPQIVQFFKSVKLMRDINQTIFALLNTYTPLPPPAIMLIRPPAVDNATQQQFLNLDERENGAVGAAGIGDGGGNNSSVGSISSGYGSSFMTIRNVNSASYGGGADFDAPPSSM